MGIINIKINDKENNWYTYEFTHIDKGILKWI